MSKKFDAEAYVKRWDGKVLMAMIGVILVSLVLAIVLNIATRPDCLRHEYIFCGSEAVHHEEEEGVPHGNPKIPEIREMGGTPH